MNRGGKKRDIYFRRAKELNYRARSAFKLLQVDEKFGIFDGVRRAVDLCAAPGSWTQVLSRCVGERLAAEGANGKRGAARGTDGGEARKVATGRDTKKNTAKETEANNPKEMHPIVSVDLQEMAPVPHAHVVMGDITSRATADYIVGYFGGAKVDLVVCDGAPDVTGLHDVDEYLQSQLLLAALNITSHMLRRGGAFVAKVFRGPCFHLLEMQLRLFFREVHCFKPRSSRVQSAEHFVVCRFFEQPKNYTPSLFSAVPKDGLIYTKRPSEAERHGALVPFLACGDLSPFDTAWEGKGNQSRVGSCTSGAKGAKYSSACFLSPDKATTAQSNDAKERQQENAGGDGSVGVDDRGSSSKTFAC